MNKKPFIHLASFGTYFKCDTYDFSTPIHMTCGIHKSPEYILRDVAEMIGYHAVNIYPELNGFRGYDCLRFVVD